MLWPGTIRVRGLYDQECTSDRCLRKKANKCFLLKMRYNNPADAYAKHSSCVLNYLEVGTAYAYGAGSDTIGYPNTFVTLNAAAASRHASWTNTYTYDGTANKLCGTTAAIPTTRVCRAGSDCSSGYRNLAVVDATETNGAKLALPSTLNTLTGSMFVPFTTGLFREGGNGVNGSFTRDLWEGDLDGCQIQNYGMKFLA